MGTVYLLHFDQPIGSSNPRGKAQHYIGYYDNARRISHHKNNTSGVKIIEAFNACGIKFTIARKWKNVPKSFERRLKNRKEAPALCPICCKAHGKKPKPAQYIQEQEENQCSS